ncbi:MAG TPA: hydantoinase/oxoprolinase family protein [Streptosporangiaceae bacterium]|nr:hydantoinase/oxoprolinase family protein [Streptosporangiaceae bacterium]
MSGTIDIDIGGTFTDCYAQLGSEIAWCKTRTTGYDLSRGMLQAIEEAASRLGVSTTELLSDTDIIRYSTTLALNSLLEAKGPRLGYITTEGFEDNLLIGRGSQWSDGLSIKQQRNVARAVKPQPLINRELMVGVKARMDHRGREVRPLDEQDFLRKLDRLVDAGVRGFVVCLLWSHVNPAHERRIRELIELEYGESYLGHAQVFLSSENSPRRLEYTRATTTLLNAYLHASMYTELSGIGQRLRTGGYRAPLIMVHNTGGMASVLRSTAIQTFSGGPVAGLMGSAHLGRAYGFENVVVTDMGGTSFDIGLIVSGSTRFYQLAPTVDRWLVDATMLDTHSIGAGGGSIARINDDVGGRLEVGPESAGSMPGPACYGQGGREPTVTDADLVLGYVNPARFNGGQLRINPARAERALRERIAGPLGVSVTDAALLVKRIVDAHMGAVIHKETVLKGYDPRDFVIFAAGGAGPLHACGYAEAAGMTQVVTFPFAPVFCAYGSSTMDVLHVYEQSAHFTLFDGNTRQWLTDTGGFNAIVDALAGHAARDFAGEGFDAGAVEYSLELDMKFGGQLNVKRVAAPAIHLTGPDDVRGLYQAFEVEYSEAYSPLGLNPDAGVEIDALVLKARLRQPQQPPPAPERPAGGGASLGTRPAVWELGAGPVDTPVFEAAALAPGTKITGPALVEAETTTTAVAPGWSLVVDERSAFILTHEQGQ